MRSARFSAFLQIVEKPQFFNEQKGRAPFHMGTKPGPCLIYAFGFCHASGSPGRVLYFWMCSKASRMMRRSRS